MKFKTMFAMGLMAVAAFFALTLVQCSKERDNAAANSASQQVADRDDPDPATSTSNYAFTYKLDGQNSTETAFNALGESVYKHAVITEALPTEPADLLHVEMQSFTTRAGYEAWGDTKGFKVRQSLRVDDRLKTVADSLGLTETSEIPQWYVDYATGLQNAELGIPNLCYVSVMLRQHTDGSGAFNLTLATKPFKSLFGHFMDNRASFARFKKLLGCEPPFCNLKGYDKKFWTGAIMTVTVKAEIGFSFTNSFSPLNDRISSFHHWSNL